MSGAVNARKWSAKWRNWNISDIVFSLSSIESRKERKRPEIFAPCMGTIAPESTARRCFYSFKEDRFDISDTSCLGRPSGFDEDRFNTHDPCQCIRELADVMNCDHSPIVRHFHPMDKIKKSGVCVPHALSQMHKYQRVAICASMLVHHWLAHEQHWPFLTCIVTSDEEWCLYANIRKRKKCLSHN